MQINHKYIWAIIAIFLVSCVVITKCNSVKDIDEIETGEWKIIAAHAKTLKDDCRGIPSVFVLDSGKPGPVLGLIGGVHGNEPAGSVSLNMLILGEGKWNMRPKRGKIIIIPNANECGLHQGTRTIPEKNVNTDLNRNFSEFGGTDEKSNEIAKILANADLVIDFHEAWGWYYDNNGSVGSTLTPTSQPMTYKISEMAIGRINREIGEPRLKFQVREFSSCDIKSTLACHMESNKKNYILVETSGQNDVQPLGVRVNQAYHVLATAINELF